MAEEVATQLGAEPRRELCRKELGREGHEHAQKAYGHKQEPPLQDVGLVPRGYADVNHLGHNEGNHQAEQGLEQLEERREHAFDLVIF